MNSLARYKFQNYVKEIFFDSDTNLALLSGAPFDDPPGGSSPTSRSPRRAP